MSRPLGIRKRAEEALETAGAAGMLSAELASALQVEIKTLWTAVWYATRDGAIGWWPDPIGRQANRRRYWLAKHKPTHCPAPSGTPTAWLKPISEQSAGLSWRAKPASTKRADGVTITRAEGYRLDGRYQIEDLPAGYVSALNGDECRPWAVVAAQARA